MVLNACVEAFFRIFFELLKYSIDNFISVILTLVIVGFIAKRFGALILGIIAFLLDLGLDIIFAGSVGLTAPINLLGGIVIGMLWAMMTLNSNVSILIKLPNAIMMFMFGFVWGLAPVPFPIPLAPIVGWLLENSRFVNYIIGIFSLGATYIVISLGSPLFVFMCEGINYILTLF